MSTSTWMSARCIFFQVLISAIGSVDGQLSQSSCLVQARFENAKSDALRSESPFSMQQQQCITDYVQAVRSHLPDYDLSDRRFGGASPAPPPPTAPPILGAGFGGTATRSLAALGRQLGLKVSRADDLAPELLISNESAAQRSKLNEVNFSQVLVSSGMDMLLHSPMAEFFLDFYAASPDSKVVLTLRDPTQWAKRRMRRLGTRIPVESPSFFVGAESLGEEALAELMESHETLVRCMVTPSKLLEVNVFETPSTTKIAQFLGLTARDFEVPMPQVPRQGERNDANGERLPICITGQIRRLELRTKIQRLIQPAVDEGYRVEVYLVLDPRHETTYIHRAAGTDVGNYTIVEGDFETLHQTEGLFPPNVSVIFDPFIPRDYAIDERYAEELMHGKGGQDVSLPPGSLDLAKERAKSHVRQWEALARCYELFQVMDDTPPQVALRIRDDFAFVERFVPPLDTLERGLHVPNCETNQGLNDKAALVLGAGEVEAYFTQPLSLMRHNFSHMLALQHARKSRPMNPESVLFNAMTLSKVQQFVDDFPAYRVTMLRDAENPTSKTQLCYVAGAHHESCLSERIWTRLKARTIAVYANATTAHKEPEERKAAYFCEMEDA